MSKKKRLSMDDIRDSLENDIPTEIEKNTMKLDELNSNIKILNETLLKLMQNLPQNNHQTSYIS